MLEESHKKQSQNQSPVVVTVTASDGHVTDSVPLRHLRRTSLGNAVSFHDSIPIRPIQTSTPVASAGPIQKSAMIGTPAHLAAAFKPPLADDEAVRPSPLSKSFSDPFLNEQASIQVSEDENIMSATEDEMQHQKNRFQEEDNESHSGEIRSCSLCCCASRRVRRKWQSNGRIPSTVNYLIFSLILLAPGLVFHFVFPKWADGIVLPICIMLSVAVGGQAFCRLIILGIWNLLEHLKWGRHSPLVYYGRALTGYLAFSIWLIVILLVWLYALVPLWRERKVEWYDSFDTYVERFIAVLLVTTVLLALKRILVLKLTLSFNYANYLTRIQDALFSEQVIEALSKAKDVYKAKMRLSANVTARTQRPLHRPVSVPTGLSHLFDVFTHHSNQQPQQQHISSVATIHGASAISTRLSPPHAPATAVVAPSPRLQSAPRQYSAPMPRTGTPEWTETAAAATTPIDWDASSMDDFSQISNNGEKPETPKVKESLAKPSTSLDAAAHHELQEFALLASRDEARFRHSAMGDYRSEIHRYSHRLATRLHKWLRHSPTATHILPRDLMPYLPETAIRDRAIVLLTRKENGQISLKDLSESLSSIYRERYRLARSVNSMQSAVQNVGYMLTGLALLVALVFASFIMQVNMKDTFVSFTSVFLGLSFMFSGTAKDAFESVIFLFVVHPFDVGDRIYLPINDSRTEFHNMVVAEMHILTTVFERFDGVRVYLPNHVLARRMILNVRRSGCMSEVHRLQIDFDTPSEKLATLKAKLQEFVRREAADFTERVSVNLDAVENVNRLHVNVVIQHRQNWQDLPSVNMRRTKIYTFLQQVLSELEIQYFPPVQRVEMKPSPSIGGIETSGDILADENPATVTQRATLNRI